MKLSWPGGCSIRYASTGRRKLAKGGSPPRKSYYVNRALEGQIQELEHRYSARKLARRAADEPERILPLYELECALGADD